MTSPRRLSDSIRVAGYSRILSRTGGDFGFIAAVKADLAFEGAVGLKLGVAVAASLIHFVVSREEQLDGISGAGHTGETSSPQASRGMYRLDDRADGGRRRKRNRVAGERQKMKSTLRHQRDGHAIHSLWLTPT